MRVSQRLDYALRALVLLALQPQGEYVAAGDLADRLGLPRRFVEQQVTALVARRDRARADAARAGGCALARPAAEITVLRCRRRARRARCSTCRRSDRLGGAELWRRRADAARRASSSGRPRRRSPSGSASSTARRRRCTASERQLPLSIARIRYISDVHACRRQAHCSDAVAAVVAYLAVLLRSESPAVGWPQVPVSPIGARGASQWVFVQGAREEL